MKKKENAPEPIGKEADELSPLLRNLQAFPKAQQVPEGYFESLNSRIIDTINDKKQQNSPVAFMRKKVMWIPLTLTTAIAVLLIFVVPLRKVSVAPLSEMEQLELAYDPTYAEEALLNESLRLENEIAGIQEDADATNGILLTNASPSEDEIVEYLKSECTETEILTE